MSSKTKGLRERTPMRDAASVMCDRCRVIPPSVGGRVALIAACDLRSVARDIVMYILKMTTWVFQFRGTIPRHVREIGSAITWNCSAIKKLLYLRCVGLAGR